MMMDVGIGCWPLFLVAVVSDGYLGSLLLVFVVGGS